jgi:hypothetical protein
MSHLSPPGLTPPPVPAGPLPQAFRLIAGVERAFAWVLAYPLLSLQILFFLLVAWAGLGKGLGLDDAFWHEDAWWQGYVGLAVGTLFGEILLVRYLLDPARDRLGIGPSLFAVKDPTVRQLGEYLFLFWPASLLLLFLPRLVLDLTAVAVTTPEHPARWWLDRRAVAAWHGLPLAVGLTLAVTLAWLVVWAAERWGVRRWLQESPLFQLLPGVRFKAVSPADYPLHALAFLFAVLFAVSVGVVYGLYFASSTLPPLVVIPLLLASANALYGFIAFHFRGLQHLLIALLLVTGLAFSGCLYKQSLPGLDEEYAAARRGQPLPLYEGPPGPDGQRTDNYARLLEEQRLGKVKAPSLVAGKDVLEKLKQRWQADHPGTNTKPRLVVIASSGGGIRAAVWTAVVLEGLEREIPGEPGGRHGLRDHVRLMTGASGGMVAAGLYVARYQDGPVPRTPHDPVTKLGPLSAALAGDGLSRTVDTMVLEDLPHAWWPGPVGWDRGREIERVWCGNAPELKMTFGDLEPRERAGEVPSLVYSPMLVEDARRLLISNLDLADLTHTWAPKLSVRPGFTETISPEGPALSLSAVEFARLFPGKEKALPLSTAARLNASFPWVSPGVSLPTNPPLRVVDAGYYDNDGIDVAALWLYRHRQEVKDNTSGVVLIQIRATRSDYARRKFQDKEAEKLDPGAPQEVEPGDQPQQPRPPRPNKGLLVRGLQGLSTPGEGLLSQWDRGEWYRDDELIQLVGEQFNCPGDPECFVTVSFECSVDADLSWALPRREAAAVAEGFYEDPDAGTMPPWIAKRVGRLRKWFGDGGR